MSKKQLNKILLMSFLIGISAFIFDWLWHYFILNLIYKEPLSPLGYWFFKFFIGFATSFIVLMFFKIKNIWVNSINIGLGGAVIFALVLTMFRSWINSNYNFLIHLPHFFAFGLSALIILKLFKWRG
ncbi:MAG: hypothetical protein AABY22_29860 [Nanoarchaeota archaeon]